MSESSELLPDPDRLKLVLNPGQPLQEQMDAYFKKVARKELEKDLVKLAKNLSLESKDSSNAS